MCVCLRLARTLTIAAARRACVWVWALPCRWLRPAVVHTNVYDVDAICLLCGHTGGAYSQRIHNLVHVRMCVCAASARDHAGDPAYSTFELLLCYV